MARLSASLQRGEGMVLSVPLTAVARLVLAEVNHPYAKPIVWILKGGKKEGTMISDPALM